MFIRSRQSRPELSGQDLDPIPRLGRSAAPRDNDVGWCRCALTIWPGTEAPELFRAHYARLSARSLDGLAYRDVLAGAIILKNKHNWLAMYHSLGVNISGDLFGQRATAFIDDALAWHGA